MPEIEIKNRLLVRHFLLDYDGLLVDSEKVYFKTWSYFLTAEGIEICQKNHEGMYETEVFELVKNHLIDKGLSLNIISRKREEMFVQLCSEHCLSLVNGIRELLPALSNIAPLSVVSNSKIEIVQSGLRSNGILNYFHSFFCADGILSKKPSPDLYNLALNKLKVSRTNVLAFEDSMSGLLAAKKATIRVVCINTKKEIHEFCKINEIPCFSSPFEFIQCYPNLFREGIF